MATDAKKPTPLEILAANVKEKYRTAYLVLANTETNLSHKKDNEKDHAHHLLDEMLKAIVLVQGEDTFMSRGTKDTKNIFLLNSLSSADMLKYDRQLPEKLFLWEYEWNFKFPEDSFFENNEIIADKDMYRDFLILFLNRFFQRGIDEEVTMVDRVVANTLIKLNVIKRTDPAEEDLTSTFTSLLRGVLS